MVSFYQLYELNHAALAPWRAVADATRLTFQNPLNPLFDTPFGRSVAAAAELFERTTRRYGKPEFGLSSTEVGRRAGGRLRRGASGRSRSARCCTSGATCRRTASPDPKLLIVAPLSGHYATLLRGTVDAMLPGHEVYITDWADARMVPVVGRPFRPRRLHRLPDRVPASPRAERACDGGMPAVCAGARDRRAAVGGPRSRSRRAR